MEKVKEEKKRVRKEQKLKQTSEKIIELLQRNDKPFPLKFIIEAWCKSRPIEKSLPDLFENISKFFGQFEQKNTKSA